MIRWLAVAGAGCVLATSACGDGSYSEVVLGIRATELKSGGLVVHAPPAGAKPTLTRDEAISIALPLADVPSEAILRAALLRLTDELSSPPRSCLCWVVSIDADHAPPQSRPAGPDAIYPVPTWSVVVIEATSAKPMFQRTGGDGTYADSSGNRYRLDERSHFVK